MVNLHGKGLGLVILRGIYKIKVISVRFIKNIPTETLFYNKKQAACSGILTFTEIVSK